MIISMSIGRDGGTTRGSWMYNNFSFLLFFLKIFSLDLAFCSIVKLAQNPRNASPSAQLLKTMYKCTTRHITSKRTTTHLTFILSICVPNGQNNSKKMSPSENMSTLCEYAFPSIWNSKIIHLFTHNKNQVNNWNYLITGA